MSEPMLEKTRRLRWSVLTLLVLFVMGTWVRHRAAQAHVPQQGEVPRAQASR